MLNHDHSINIVFGLLTLTAFIGRPCTSYKGYNFHKCQLRKYWNSLESTKGRANGGTLSSSVSMYQAVADTDNTAAIVIMTYHLFSSAVLKSGRSHSRLQCYLQ